MTENMFDEVSSGGKMKQNKSAQQRSEQGKLRDETVIMLNLESFRLLPKQRRCVSRMRNISPVTFR